MALKLLTDSSCDLPLHIFKENKDIVDFIGIPVAIEGKDCIDDLGDEFSHEFFYNKLSEGEMPKTSQINSQVFFDKFEEYVKNGDEIIYIGLTSGLSGTFNNAMIAKNMIEEEYKVNNITVIETYSASIGLGMIVVEVIDIIKEQWEKERVVNWIKENMLTVNHWFAVDNLEHLRKGGRISSTAAIVGTALSVKPILTVTHKGALETYTKIRGRNKAIKFLQCKYCEHCKEIQDEVIVIGHANCLEDAQKLEKLILSNNMGNNILITQLSATIASHVGQGMLAIAFMGKENRE